MGQASENFTPHGSGCAVAGKVKPPPRTRLDLSVPPRQDAKRHMTPKGPCGGQRGRFFHRDLPGVSRLGCRFAGPFPPSAESLLPQALLTARAELRAVNHASHFHASLSGGAGTNSSRMRPLLVTARSLFEAFCEPASCKLFFALLVRLMTA